MKLFNLLVFRLELLFEIFFNDLSSVVIFIFFFLMELEFLLDNCLDEVLPKAFNKVEFVFKDNNTEENLSALELAFSKLELSDFSNFFQYGLYFPFKILIKSHNFKWPVYWERTLNFFHLFLLIFIFRVNQVIYLNYFICWRQFRPIPFIVHQNLLSCLYRNTKCKILSIMILLFIVLLPYHL